MLDFLQDWTLVGGRRINSGQQYEVNGSGRIDERRLPPAEETRLDEVGGVEPWLWRCFDVLGALVLLLILLPLIVLITLAIYLDDAGPIIFRHRRIGRHGHHFECLKFRTMHLDASGRLFEYLQLHPELLEEWGSVFKLRKDPRVTRIGRWLRKLSLDELPQLLNILRGEMSLVGPRPIVDEEVKRYGPNFACYCKVRPGLTGLWQVSGRNDTTYEQRVALDCEYVARKSVLFDTLLIIRTVPAIIIVGGAY